jgi:hypothetical protein
MKSPDIAKILENYASNLRKHADQNLEEVAKLPEGYILTRKIGGKQRLYRRIRIGVGNFNDTYLRESDKPLREKMARKMFLEKLAYSQIQGASLIEESIQLLKKAENACEEKHIIDSLPDGLKELVKTHRLSDDKALAKFLDVSPNMMKNHHKINTGLFTKQGEEVRSKSELIIANMLHDAGIPYHYELVLAFSVEPGFIDVAFPDFTVMNIRTGKIMYWEHFGMLDTQKYFSDYVKKMENYSAYGYLPGRDVILSFETSESGLKTKTVAALINQFLK